MEAPYSNREISEKWNDIANALSRIEVQTTTTNGRVSKLERYQAYLSGATGVIVLIVIPLLGWAMFKLSTIDASIQASTHQAVDQALSAYNIK